MLMPSRESPSGCSLSLIFLSTGIWPFPRIWSTLINTHTLESHYIIQQWCYNIRRHPQVRQQTWNNSRMFRVSKTHNTLEGIGAVIDCRNHLWKTCIMIGYKAVCRFACDESHKRNKYTSFMRITVYLKYSKTQTERCFMQHSIQISKGTSQQS